MNTKQEFVSYRPAMQRTTGMLKLITNFGTFNVYQHPTLEQMAQYAVKATAAGIKNKDIIFRVVPVTAISVAEAMGVME